VGKRTTMLQKQILLLYFSGSGSTRTISEILKHKLEILKYQVDLVDIDIKTNPNIISKYDFIILGTPTYHGYPSKTLSGFLNEIEYQSQQKSVFLFATYGLYQGNNLRMLAKELLQKNIKTIGSAGFRGPASDGVLLLPSWIKFMFDYEKNIKNKLDNAVKQIDSLYMISNPKIKIPFYKWYVPFDRIPNKMFAARQFHKNYVPHLKILTQRWDGNKIDCPRYCWNNSFKPPRFNKINCEFCLRCVHRTPNDAVVFSEGMKDKKRFDETFYNNLKNKLL
jgi:flavodoxin